MEPGAVCLKKPHHIIILRFSEVVKGHAKCDKTYVYVLNVNKYKLIGPQAPLESENSEEHDGPNKHSP